TSAIDPVGNQTKYVYGDSNYPWLPTSIERYASNGVLIATNQLSYTYATNVVVNGYVSFTNQAFGLVSRSIRAAVSSVAATTDFFYDGRGFLTNQINYTGTSDPNITSSFFYNSRGELIQQTDAAGRSTRFDYDGLGHVKAKEVVTGQLKSGHRRALQNRTL
ncbi:MAG TPA: RHS repeat domain-containing protein, partial [Pyrinomonadaceae bacterium]|nr:RHS repeat domain-containing protein [Pyrinomonadaceae bacterium]